MDVSAVKEKICDVVQKYIPLGTSDTEYDTAKPLSSQPYCLEPVALAAVMLDIQRNFEIDLNVVFDSPFDFSIDHLIQAIINQKDECLV